MGPTWVLSAPDGPHVGPMNLAIMGGLCTMCGQLPSDFVLKWSGGMWSACVHGPLARYVKLRVVHAPGMPVTFSPPPWVSDPDMHHGTCVPHEPRYRSGSLTSGFLWSRWRESVSRHSRRMRNPQFYVSGKRSIGWTLTGVTGAVETCSVHTLPYPCDTWYVCSTLQELAVSKLFCLSITRSRWLNACRGFWIMTINNIPAGSNNGLAPTRRKAFNWINDGWKTDAYMCHSASMN